MNSNIKSSDNIRKIIGLDGSLVAVEVKDFTLLTNSQFITNDCDFLQVGAFKYDKPHDVKKHRHNEIARTVNRTQELIYILTGTLTANIFDDGDNFLISLSLTQGNGLLILSGWHDFLVSKECNFFEVKVGPYLGNSDKTIME